MVLLWRSDARFLTDYLVGEVSDDPNISKFRNFRNKLFSLMSTGASSPHRSSPLAAIWWS
jgi:hypothetical protein